jgi:Flp pilus assembly pilin Flp
MIKQFLKDERGQDIVEYSLLLVLISAVAILILTGMGTSIKNIFTKVTNSLNQAETNIGK